ncbi:MAG: hypothetical protein H7Z40_13205 [Phycisphaerae bacterium]|nr:hypothetical protein [Gemmatimonadaceae bacterium]
MRLTNCACCLFIALASSAGAQLREMGISAVPTLIIGDNESDESTTFGSVEGATRLPDGRIVVGDRGAFSIRVFAADGKLVKRLGPKGAGPGEFQYLAHLWRCGDEIFVYDIQNGYRISVFSLDLSYKREFRFGGPDLNSPYSSATACNGNKQFVHHGWDKSPPSDGVVRKNVPFWISRADDKVGARIGQLPGSERWAKITSAQTAGSRPLPFGKQPVIAIGTNRVYVGTAEKFEIMVFDLTGKRVGLLQDNTPLVPVTKADIEKEIALTPGNTSAAAQKRLETSYAEMVLPKTMPAFGAFVVDALDNLWVQDYKRAMARHVRWTVFAPDGKLLARVQLPTDLTVHEIGRDYILGHYQDLEEAIPQVRMYRLTR